MLSFLVTVEVNSRAMSSRRKSIDPDKCAFINCNNGKHNGYHLFRFPRGANRQQIWINRSGKYTREIYF